jgi:HSP20 family protein
MTLVKFKNSGPLGQYAGLSRSMDFPSFFNNALERFWSEDADNLSWLPSANIKERAQDYKIDLAVPGMDKKDFQIEVENKVLTVSGERKEEVQEENEKMTRREFHYGSF